MDSYLQYFGGTAGVIALTGIAAASALYFATRPTSEEPLVPLHAQSPVLEVSIPGSHIEESQIDTSSYQTIVWNLLHIDSCVCIIILKVSLNIIYDLFLSLFERDNLRVRYTTFFAQSYRVIPEHFPAKTLVSFFYEKMIKEKELEVKSS